METKSKEKWFFYILIAAVGAFTFALFLPFFSLICVGAALAVVIYPVFDWINRKLAGGRSWLSALICVLLAVILLGIPLFFIGARVFSESSSLYVSLSNGSENGGVIDSLSSSIQEMFPGAPTFSLQDVTGNIVSVVAGFATTIFTKTLHTGLSLVLVLMLLFYFLKDGKEWRKYIIQVSPLSDQHDERILTLLGRAVNGVMLGYIFIALIQGVLLGVGLWFFGVPNAALFGLIAGFASMIPSIGTAFVSLPAVLFLLATGHTSQAIGLLAWAALLVGTIDNFLSPVFVGKKIELPPLLILLSVLGALSLVGPVGVIIGPLAVSVFHTLLIIYKENFQTAS